VIESTLSRRLEFSNSTVKIHCCKWAILLLPALEYRHHNSKRYSNIKAIYWFLWGSHCSNWKVQTSASAISSHFHPFCLAKDYEDLMRYKQVCQCTCAQISIWGRLSSFICYQGGSEWFFAFVPRIWFISSSRSSLNNGRNTLVELLLIGGEELLVAVLLYFLFGSVFVAFMHSIIS